ncbi:hypothetical protein HID58_072443 [Brassica napus]|uniref:BnaC06g26210D protein n=3 Tax=Brassica TaxID=3705 RepID=A0A078GW11_BRANA|nr:hypothetical protein HID58_072443 [Brassica napus]CAF2062275.1 unnamed protein product [Brassica napus]CDY28833.1 BnaC06g26210D [Brassica napus]VDD63453.1 unnamed protein product [Brassica oleracea]
MARSSAKAAIATLLTVISFFLPGGLTHHRSPTTYIVGNEFGWDLSIPADTWASDKTFYIFSVQTNVNQFIFRYDYQLDNMLVVNQTGYETCIPNEGYIEYNTGEDMIQLAYGGNYFIGTATPGDCWGGMKLAINALAPDNKD